MFKRISSHNICIESSDNAGFVVKCGCATMVYSNIDQLIIDLSAYLKNPKEAEEEYNKFCKELSQVRDLSSGILTGLRIHSGVDELVPVGEHEIRPPAPRRS